MADGNAAFSELCLSTPYKGQAVWFLNGFWHDIGIWDREEIWKWCHSFMELDPEGEGGMELDEFWSHKFLETLNETLTVLDMREMLRTIDTDNNGRMAFLEYLIYKFDKTPSACANAPQGDNSEEVARVQELFNELNEALNEALEKLEMQRAAVAELQAAEEELREAEAELRAQEEAYANKMADLQSKVDDPNLGVVKKNRARNEIAQMEAEDPLPLSRAKITNGAAQRRVAKAKKVEEQKQAELEAAAADLEEKMEAARIELEEVKKHGGTAEGQIWWMERELIEAEKYLPKAKQQHLDAYLAELEANRPPEPEED